MLLQSLDIGGGRLFLVVVLSLGAVGTAGEPTASTDLDLIDQVLKTHVDARGMVQYSVLKANRTDLDRYVAALSRVSAKTYAGWEEKKKVAFWINAYNGLTLRAIIDHYPIKSSFWTSRVYPKNSIRQIKGVWDGLAWGVMGKKLTLEHIEHEILRKQFNEPRIHLALVCAAIGCPPLRNEAYRAERLDAQFKEQTVRFLGDRAKFRIDRRAGRVYLSPIFKWFGEDFVKAYGTRAFADQGKENGAVLNFVSGHLNPTDARYLKTGSFGIRFLDYDWTLNEQAK